MAGVGVTWDNLWSGPGVPFGGSLIMMAVDTVLYGLAAYWLDAVIPSEYFLCVLVSHLVSKNSVLYVLPELEILCIEWWNNLKNALKTRVGKQNEPMVKFPNYIFIFLDC